jgi:hypothetical protein
VDRKWVTRTGKMLETLFSGASEGGVFIYNCSYLIYIKRALLLSCVVVAFSPLMPFFALPVAAGFNWVVLYAKLGIIHALVMSVQHLVLTPTKHASIAVLGNDGVFWAPLKQFNCLQDALVGNLIDPKDLDYVIPPSSSAAGKTGLELADYLQQFYIMYPDQALSNMELCWKFLIFI